MTQCPSEIPVVSMCSVNECLHNSGINCGAGTITIGSVYPACESFMEGAYPAGRMNQEAFVGSCKMRNYKFNDDLECMAGIILMGVVENKAICITFACGSEG
jgi:Domain of Unknown Function (DUF1540)